MITIRETNLPSERKAEATLVQRQIRQHQMKEWMKNVIRYYSEDYLRWARDTVKSLIESYCYDLEEQYKSMNKDHLWEWYEQSMEWTGRNTNNGDNLEWFEEYVTERFYEEMAGWTIDDKTNLLEYFDKVLQYEIDIINEEIMEDDVRSEAKRELLSMKD